MDEATVAKIVASTLEQANRDTGNPVLNLILGLGSIAIVAFAAVYIVLKLKGAEKSPREDRGEYEVLKMEQHKTAEAVEKLDSRVKELEEKVDHNYKALSKELADGFNDLQTKLLQIAMGQNKTV